MKAECYECTRFFERASLLPIEDLFSFILGEPDPVGICPRCGGVCLPVVEPLSMEAVRLADAVSLAALNSTLTKSLP